MDKFSIKKTNIYLSLIIAGALSGMSTSAIALAPCTVNNYNTSLANATLVSGDCVAVTGGTALTGSATITGNVEVVNSAGRGYKSLTGALNISSDATGATSFIVTPTIAQDHDIESDSNNNVVNFDGTGFFIANLGTNYNNSAVTSNNGKVNADGVFASTQSGDGFQSYQSSSVVTVKNSRAVVNIMAGFNASIGVMITDNSDVYAGVKLSPTTGKPVDSLGNDLIDIYDATQYVASGKVSMGVNSNVAGKSYINTNNTGVATGGSSIVKTYGAASTAMSASGNNSKITAANVDITTLGANSLGVYASSGGVITLTTPTSGKTNINSTGNSFDAENSTATITASLSGSTISSSAGLLANSYNTGVINITADNATTMTGGTAVNAGSILNITLNDLASTWNMPILSTITSLTNAGTLKFTNTAPGISLNFAADYAGNAGKVILNTALGDDSSTTDKLIVAGNTSGTSKLTINNIGGLGAATTVGIPVITVAGASDAVFTLSNPVIVGGFEYKLVKGGNPLNPGNPNNWYLVSMPYVAVSSPIPATGLAGLLALFILLATALVFRTKKYNKGFKPLV